MQHADLDIFKKVVLKLIFICLHNFIAVKMVIIFVKEATSR